MKILVNQKEVNVDSTSTLNDVLKLAQMKPPFAVAINMVFVPSNEYATTKVNELDQIEVISPITGG